MGYLGNHLATVATGAFAAVLTGLWPWFVNDLGATVLHFVFLMAVPIAWFLTLMCWLSQKSADYVHRHGSGHPGHREGEGGLAGGGGGAVQGQALAYGAGGQQATPLELREAKTELTDELNSLRDTVKIKDTEIERLKQEIANLETLVQIESLKTELANLKVLASKG